MTDWIEPVVDRTEEDVLLRTVKGVLQADDLNRIENDIEYLLTLLNIKRPFRPQIYTMASKPTKNRFVRILVTTRSIRVSYTVTSSTPPLDFGLPLNTWEKWNAIEANLQDVYKIYSQAQEMMVYCGEAFSGEMIGVI